jgi:hypothetical protein
MISINVRTMTSSAQRLARMLRERGFRVWVCTESMRAGDDFREAIVKAVKGCDVFIPLINDAWARSGECKDEFSLAKRLNLTSHESGRTAEGGVRKPLFVPVAFSDLDWEAHSHVQLLAASTHFIVHSAKSLDEGDTPSTCEQISSGILRQFGLGTGESTEALEGAYSSEPDGATPPPGMPEMEGVAELLAVERAQAQLNLVQRNLMAARTAWEAKRARDRAAVQTFSAAKLGLAYMGTAITTVAGCHQVFTVEFRWVVGEPDPHSGRHDFAPAMMLATPISVTAVEDTADAREREAKFAELIGADAKAAVVLRGGFEPKTGVIDVAGNGFMSAAQYADALRALTSAERSADSEEASIVVEASKAVLGAEAKIVYPLCEYRLLMSTDGNEMTGVFDRPPESGRDTDRRGVPKWSAPLRLRRYA